MTVFTQNESSIIYDRLVSLVFIQMDHQSCMTG